MIRFLKPHDPDIAIISKVALAHAQFETIQPFPDGNSRMGHLLITLIMFQAGALNQPLLYLSLQFKRHWMDSYNVLTRVRGTHAWARWLSFFFNGIVTTAR